MLQDIQDIQWNLEIDLFNCFSNCTFFAVPSHRLTTATDVFMVFLIYTLIPISLLHKIYQKLRNCCEKEEEKKQERKLDEEVFEHTQNIKYLASMLRCSGSTPGWSLYTTDSTQTPSNSRQCQWAQPASYSIQLHITCWTFSSSFSLVLHVTKKQTRK